MPSDKRRLLIVGATYSVAENRKKLTELAKYFDVCCATSDHSYAFGVVTRNPPVPAAQNFMMRAFRPIGAVRTTTRYVLPGIGRLMRDFRPHLVLVEAEPWAFIRWQTWWQARRVREKTLFGEFSWENVERPGWKGRLLGIAYRAAVATADFVIAGNQAAGELFRKHGFSASRLLVSPQLGVDTVLFEPVDDPGKRALRQKRGVDPGCFVIGFAGRLVEYKGIRDLLAAVRALRAESPERRMECHFLGGGPLEQELRALAVAEPWLKLAPPVVHEAVAEFMQILDVFVLPSRSLQGDNGEHWQEQFGHVLIEAMACGIPVLGSDCGAIPEVIGHPDQVFGEGDVAALTARLRNQMLDPAGARETGRTGLARVHEIYANNVLAAHWADFLRSLPQAD